MKKKFIKKIFVYTCICTNRCSPLLFSQLTSSKTRLMNLKESSRVSIISDTGTPTRAKGTINHRSADASCSGGVVVRHRLALWKIFSRDKRKRTHQLLGTVQILKERLSSYQVALF